MKRPVFIFMIFALCSSLCGQRGKWSAVNYYYNVGDYDAMKQVLDTMSIANNKDTVKWLSWMGEYYYWLSYEQRDKGNLARQCFEKAIQVGNERHVSGMPYGFYHLHLGELEYLYGEYDKSMESLNVALNEYPYRATRTSQPTKDPCPVYKGLAMCYAMKGEYERALGFLDSCQAESSGATSVARMCGKVFALKGDKEQSRKCYEQFIGRVREEVKDSFLRLDARHRETWWVSVRPFIADCWRLENSACDLLYDVALLAKGILLQQRVALDYRHEDVRAAMHDDEVAIEWMTYERDGVKRLGAVVMRYDGSMNFVETALASEIASWGYDEDEIFENEEYASKIWSDKMMNAIGSARKIYFAPDGALNQMGIEYLFPDSTRELYRLTSTRELIKRRQVRVAGNAMVLGAMDYNATLKGEIGEGNDNLAYDNLKKKGFKARNLVNSLPECDSVMAIRSNPMDSLLTGNEVTEHNFRSLVGRYELMLVSTHGYCCTSDRFESSDFPRREIIDRSMSESVLLFTGVNSELAERHGDYDGIVSAKELSAMDMSAVDLCVVSACEGAKGKVSADGTYGLQRGLKAAGVGGMVLSMWEVHDAATRLFIQTFFRGIKDGKTVRQAFWNARTSLRQTSGFNTPRIYNAFILIDIV